MFTFAVVLTLIVLIRVRYFCYLNIRKGTRARLSNGTIYFYYSCDTISVFRLHCKQWVTIFCAFYIFICTNVISVRYNSLSICNSVGILSGPSVILYFIEMLS